MYNTYNGSFKSYLYFRHSWLLRVHCKFLPGLWEEAIYVIKVYAENSSPLDGDRYAVSTILAANCEISLNMHNVPWVE